MRITKVQYILEVDVHASIARRQYHKPNTVDACCHPNSHTRILLGMFLRKPMLGGRQCIYYLPVPGPPFNIRLNRASNDLSWTRDSSFSV
jgi:hypothetical protein